MRAVFKWTVRVDDKFHPIGAGPVVHVECQFNHNEVQVWTEETSRTPEVRAAVVMGTGQQLVEDTEHIGSTIPRMVPNGILVWHVYASTRGA